MSVTTILVFVLGVALGWRYRVGSVIALAGLILLLGVIDLLIGLFTSNPITHSFLIDFISAQLGYVVGATAHLIVVKLRNRR